MHHFINNVVPQYSSDRWAGQEYYVEVWVEKDALSGVLNPISRKYHVHLVVNKGYSSASAMYDAKDRFIEAMNDGKKCVILYFGDLDPSGEDMVRDINNRLTIMGAEITVKKLALTFRRT